MLARASAAPAEAGATVRRIVLDANVFDQLRRGNIAAANKLLEVQKHEVYVSWEAFQEWVVRPPDRTQANTARQIIDKLKIKMAPPAPAAVVADLRARNSVRKGTATILSKESDLMIAAEAKALNAEVWSFDRAFKGNPGASVEKTLGVKVAAETTTVEKVFGDAAKVRQPKPKESRALRILGIKEDPVAGHLPEGKVAAPSTTPTGGGAAAKEAESVAVKEAESAAVKEAESVAVKEAG